MSNVYVMYVIGDEYNPGSQFDYLELVPDYHSVISGVGQLSIRILRSDDSRPIILKKSPDDSNRVRVTNSDTFLHLLREIGVGTLSN